MYYIYNIINKNILIINIITSYYCNVSKMISIIKYKVRRSKKFYLKVYKVHSKFFIIE